MFVRSSTYLLLGLLLVGTFGLCQAVYREVQLRAVPPTATGAPSAEAFASELSAVSDPETLRQMALGRHQALLRANHALRGLLLSLKTINRAELIQNTVTVLLAASILLLDRRPNRR